MEQSKQIKKSSKYKRIMGITIAFLLIFGSLYLLQKLLLPKYMSGIVEGAMIAEYYDTEKNHDLVMIGDCEIYENFSPVVLWDKYGINSIIRGSAQQLIWQSYYLMEETLRYETPKAIVFNVLSMKYNEPQKEAYNRMTLDGMKWSSSKLNSIKASMMKDEKLLDYVFPLLRYHSRITELTSEDFKYLFHKDKVTFEGYYMRVDVKPAENVPKGRPMADYRFGDNAYAYLDKMVALCKEKGVELILVKAPSLYPYWYEEWEIQIEDYAKEHNLKYVNFLELIEECKLDFNTDTYDAGLHLNLSGAEKISDWFGNFLVQEAGFTSRKGDASLNEKWDTVREAYQKEIKRQTEYYLSAEKSEEMQ